MGNLKLDLKVDCFALGQTQDRLEAWRGDLHVGCLMSLASSRWKRSSCRLGSYVSLVSPGRHLEPYRVNRLSILGVLYMLWLHFMSFCWKGSTQPLLGKIFSLYLTLQLGFISKQIWINHETIGCCSKARLFYLSSMRINRFNIFGAKADMHICWNNCCYI